MSRGKIVVILIAVALAGLIGYRSFSGSSNTQRRGGSDADAPIPVTAVAAGNEDVPLNLDALGTVQALNTVSVRPQVGGQIESIAFKEGQEIAKDGLIARIDARSYQAQLDQAVAKKKQDEAQLGGARSTLKRYEDLIQKNFVAAQDLENQRHSVRQLEALVASDEAAIANARVQLSYTTITAPIAGLAGIRQVDVGNIVQGGQSEAIVVLTQIHPINVVFNLPEQTLERVRAAGQSLKVSARDRADNRIVASGTLSVIDNQIDATTGSFKLKAEFANSENTLWPGQFVNVRLEVGSLANALTVPTQALQRGPDGSYVYLVKEDSTVALQPVKAGAEAPGGKTVILEGIKTGDKVVSEGQFRLKPGAKVLALAPGENPPPLAAPASGDSKAGEAPRRRRGGG
ncbi:multidrug efflux system membrane fusion protein [Tahibacter aquaticus]|uniref:Multidrug efflux system membrane fusion protein n=1 Tax=Tahibacter aquaticus TaxID=520092 RepID=A0A4R6Z9J3_9GAMM|nr:efflux RND transporter periplasmic adaptor subunit [Tahibacter aquaticus]TDR48573.1 multidrug efflux system membrane fusion protein [Tahibacter aquaticus]